MDNFDEQMEKKRTYEYNIMTMEEPKSFFPKNATYHDDITDDLRKFFNEQDLEGYEHYDTHSIATADSIVTRYYFRRPIK